MKNILINKDMLLNDTKYLNSDTYPDLVQNSIYAYLTQHHTKTVYTVNKFLDKTNQLAYFVSNHSLLFTLVCTYYQSYAKAAKDSQSKLMQKNINGYHYIYSNLNGDGYIQQGFVFLGNPVHLLTALVPNVQSFLDWSNHHIGD